MTDVPAEPKEDRVERLRAGLLSTSVDRKKKLGMLKKLVEHKSDPRVLGILRAAAAAPGNASMLGYVVRSFGYLPGKDALAELAPYVSHTNRVVVSNAVKALAALDRKEAVRLALPVVRGASSDASVAAARVLAERCRAECHERFLEMSTAAQPADRFAALVYLRFLPPGDAVPVLLEMLRREREPELYPVIARMLPRLVTRSGAGPVEGLRAELASKLAELDAALGALGDARTPEPPEEHEGEFAEGADGARGAAASGLVPSDVADLPSALTSGEIPALAPIAAPVSVAPPPAPVTSSTPAMRPPPAPPSPVTSSTPAMRPPPEPPQTSAPIPVPPKPSGAVPVPPSGPASRPTARDIPSLPTPVPPRNTGRTPQLDSGALPWQKKQLRRQQRIRDITRAFRLDELNDYASRRPMVVGAVITLVCYLGFLTVGRGNLPPAHPHVSDIAEGALGKLGARIKFSGTLIEVNRDYNILLIRDERQQVVSAYYPDQPVGNFLKGRKVAIEGTIREIKSERAYVVQGLTASQS